MKKDLKDFTIEDLREVGRKLKGTTFEQRLNDPELLEAWMIRNSYLRDWGILPSDETV